MIGSRRYTGAYPRDFRNKEVNASPPLYPGRSILITREHIVEAVDWLAYKVADRFSVRKYDAGRGPIFVGVLNGAMYFFPDLTRAVKNKNPYLQMQASPIVTQHDDDGNVIYHLDVMGKIKGRDIVVIDVLARRGVTLESICSRLRERSPRSINTVVLLDKIDARTNNFEVDLAGFRVNSDLRLYGYGLMDSQGEERSFDCIGVEVRGKIASKDDVRPPTASNDSE